ncbi:MAG: bifunctional diguanylate cyclase/phosphodiesterase [Lachnospiraceae bacterium]|nr:bifunctional diguanylate cyclase/phosphodiesterase [Lachnospiraceae bacterium]
MLYLFGLLCVAIIAIIVIYKKYDLMKAYYKYETDAFDKLEGQFHRQEEESKKQIEELRNIAYLNATTNIWNIDYFLEKAEKELKNEENKSSEFTLVAFNISNIGKINQLFGPTEGDKVVYFTAQTLKSLSGTSIYAQIYSNLFCILYKDKLDSYVTNSINRMYNTLLAYDSNVEIKTAYGIYKITDKNMGIMEMINYAQLAQKFIKESDEDCFKFFTTELEDTFQNNKRMSDEMEQALEDHKFVVYLQPMYDLQSYKIVSAEALVRWDYPGKGILSPYAFLPLFENTSLIQKLDYYMWEECMKTIRRWIDNKIEPTPVTINISTSHLNNGRFIDRLVALRDQYLIDRKYIILEIPEKGLTNNPITKDIINRLHNEGFILCIDNFGSMNSPLNLLKDFPIDRIKIDRSFLAKNSESEEGLTILRYLIAMAKELDFTVITEGIETDEQKDILLEIGCDIGQGYYFSKPVDLKTFDSMNKTQVSEMFRPDEYYPSFEDYERDLDLVVQFFRNNDSSASV